MAVASRLLRSPLGLLAVWTATVTVVMLPFGHRWATTDAGRIVEPVLLLLIGLAFWRVTFDEHRTRPVREAIITGGLEWWGRHALAMVGRVAILPAILALWFWPAGAYTGADAVRQELAAGVVLGAEMTIFGIAFVMFLVFVVVLDRERPTTTRRIGAADGI